MQGQKQGERARDTARNRKTIRIKMDKKLEIKGASGARFSFEGDFSKRLGKVLATSAILKLKAALEPNPAFSEEEYISVPFRFLSATLIEGHELDISEKVLKRAVKLWDKKPVQTDHEFAIAANIGITSNPVWDAESDPPGINGWMHINKIRDAENGQAVSQGLKMGTIESTSVWFFFDWKSSHPDMDEWTFWEMLGKEVDDERVRIIVTKITDVWEQSLVMLGADPNAKRLSAPEPEETTKPEKDFVENNKSKEAEMLEKLRTLFGMSDEATEDEVVNMATLSKEKAGKYDIALGKVKEAGESALSVLDEANIDVDANLKAMLKGSDDNGIRYASSEIARILAEKLPEKGRSSQTSAPPEENTEPEKTSEVKNYNLDRL